jgi:hypothetical protein
MPEDGPLNSTPFKSAKSDPPKQHENDNDNQNDTKYPASRICFVQIPPSVKEAGWHTPPGRVLAVWLDGVVEFETSDGERRHVSAGGFVLVEDTHGKGHISRHPDDGQLMILISLPGGLDLSSA